MHDFIFSANTGEFLKADINNRPANFKFLYSKKKFLRCTLCTSESNKDVDIDEVKRYLTYSTYMNMYI